MSRSYVACSVPCTKFSLFLIYKYVVTVRILCNVENVGRKNMAMGLCIHMLPTADAPLGRVATFG